MQSPRGDTEDQREMYDVFTKFAKNNVLDASCVAPALRQLNQYLTNAALGELQNEIPSAGLQFEGFLTLYQTIQENNAGEADLIDAFASLDKEKTGFIKSADVVRLLKDVGGLSEEDAHAVVDSGVDGPEGTMSFDAVVSAIGSFVS